MRGEREGRFCRGLGGEWRLRRAEFRDPGPVCLCLAISLQLRKLAGFQDPGTMGRKRELNRKLRFEEPGKQSPEWALV